MVPMPDLFFTQQWKWTGSIKFYTHFVSITKLQGFNRDQQTNYLQSEMHLKASAADLKWHTHIPNEHITTDEQLVMFTDNVHFTCS